MRIESPQNPRVKALAALKERKERERTGRFLVEGRREVERASEAGLSLETLLLGPKARPEDRALAGGAEVLELSERALARVSTRENPAQVLGVFRLPRRSLAGVTLGAAPWSSSSWAWRSPATWGPSSGRRTGRGRTSSWWPRGWTSLAPR